MSALWSLLIAGVVAVICFIVFPIAFQSHRLPAQVKHQPCDDAEDELSVIIRKFVEYYQQFKQPPASSEEPFTPLERLNAKAASLIYSPLKDTEIRLIKLHPGTANEP